MRIALQRLAFVLLLLGSILAVAQSGSGSPGGGSGTPGQSPQAISGIGKDANASALQSQGHSGDYLLGKVGKVFPELRSAVL